MPRVNISRDQLMAKNGYIRAKIIADLIGYNPSSIIRWPENTEVPVKALRFSGLHYLEWKSAVAYLNRDGDLTKILGLPNTAEELLKVALDKQAKNGAVKKGKKGK
jgi:hypothetical protein